MNFLELGGIFNLYNDNICVVLNLDICFSSSILEIKRILYDINGRL